MKIQTMMAVGFFLVGSTVAFAETPQIKNDDIMQDEF